LSTFLVAPCMIVSPSNMQPFFVCYWTNKFSLNQNGLLFKKVAIRLQSAYMWIKVISINTILSLSHVTHGKNTRATIQNCNATSPSLSTTEKENFYSTLWRRLLHLNRPVTWAQQEYPDKTTNLSKVTDKLYHTIFYQMHVALSGIRTHNISGDRHWLQR